MLIRALTPILLPMRQLMPAPIRALAAATVIHNVVGSSTVIHTNNNKYTYVDNMNKVTALIFALSPRVYVFAMLMICRYILPCRRYAAIVYIYAAIFFADATMLLHMFSLRADAARCHSFAATQLLMLR